MKAALAQINTTPRDFSGNLAKILREIHNNANCDLIVFPELAIPGYLSRDLLYNASYIENNLKSLQTVIEATKNSKCTVVVGYADRNRQGVGKPFRNMAAIIRGGMLLATYQKQLLPFYDVFDEGRYFEPGKDLTVVEICGQRWGIAICEDVWNNDKGANDCNYIANPIEAYKRIGINNFISINSSPFAKRKLDKRREILEKISERNGQIIYVNQVGAQDELVFDGHSLVCRNGVCTFCSYGPLEECTSQIDLDDLEPFPFVVGRADLPDDEQMLYEVLQVGIRDYVRKSGFKEIVVGSSGGIDSAVVLSLACAALGPENVHGIKMPGPFSSPGSIGDARELHSRLGCHDYTIPITDAYEIFAIPSPKSEGHTYNRVADENLQARLRGVTLMKFSNAYGILALTTGNKSELAVGYCTLAGDTVGSFAPISDLYKTEVYALAKAINYRQDNDIIPLEIINKAPSAELAPNQTDESTLLPYPILDSILKAYIEDYVEDYKTFKKEYIDTERTKFCSESDYNRILRLVDLNEFKRRQLAPGIKVSKVAFGTGRRLPIVKAFS